MGGSDDENGNQDNVEHSISGPTTNKIFALLLLLLWIFKTKVFWGVLLIVLSQETRNG